ncbi:hypothetical protein G6F24_018110 [Rhizopus arrhizus]|nr:hypothetical protein G6F24_018110 [Rhizopus arrhizus]
MTWLLGTVPALAKAMRAVSTLLKLRDCALAANAGMPGSSSQAFSSASVTADGCSRSGRRGPRTRHAGTDQRSRGRSAVPGTPGTTNP